MIHKDVKHTKGKDCTPENRCYNCYMREYNSRPEVKEKKRERDKKYYSKPEVREKALERSKARKDKHKEWSKSDKGKKVREKYKLTTKYKEHLKFRNSLPEQKSKKREYRKSERGKALHRQNETKRRAELKKKVPKWANLEEIKQFYLNCPEGYEVDHIIPLVNDDVSGLHTIENLQYLTGEENRKKSNKFDFTLENNSWRLE